MQFKTAAIIIAYAASVMAAPVVDSDVSTDLVELYREPAQLSSGTLIYLGHPKPPHHSASRVPTTIHSSVKPTKVAERASCPTSATPKCSSDHGAQNDLCNKLVSELYGDSGTGVAESPSQICYSGNGAYCCVSWHNVVPGLTKGDLAPYANTMLTDCTQNGVSGKTSNVDVHGTCTDVCLSNRGTHC